MSSDKGRTIYVSPVTVPVKMCGIPLMIDIISKAQPGTAMEYINIVVPFEYKNFKEKKNI